MTTEFEKRKRIKEITSDILHDSGKSKAVVVREFKQKKNRDYPQNQEMCDRIKAVVYEYAGEMSLATAIGILDIVRDEIKADQ
jgi:hypothetical protein